MLQAPEKFRVGRPAARLMPGSEAFHLMRIRSDYLTLTPPSVSAKFTELDYMRTPEGALKETLLNEAGLPWFSCA